MPPVAPPLVRPFRLSRRVTEEKFWHDLFATAVPIIFSEFDIDEELGAEMVFYTAEPLDLEDEEKENYRRISQAQLDILETFEWAISRNVRDEEKILDELRGNLNIETTPSVGEFLRRSNGQSAVWRAYFDYEGSPDDGASLNDGFSIQTVERMARPYGD